MDEKMSIMEETTAYPTRASALPMIKRNHWLFYRKLFGDSEFSVS